MQKVYKHSDITGKVIGCAMAVHNALGNGFQEVIYQRALAIEMSEKELNFSRGMRCKFFIKTTPLAQDGLIFL